MVPEANESAESAKKANGKSKEISDNVPNVKSGVQNSTGSGKTVTYSASGFQSGTLPQEFVDAVKELEQVLKMPVWMLIRRDGELDDAVWELFRGQKHILEGSESVALIVDSPGGSAKAAYQIASLLQRKCKNGFKAVIPHYAKSAATLLSLGAAEIIMEECAELGPLDAQIIDNNREEQTSALDEVQALERLHASSLEAVDKAMFFFIPRTNKKVETLLPMILAYEAQMMKPLLDKIDTVHLSQLSRVLKVAEEYAIRLLSFKHTRDEATKITRALVEKYPEHSFLIDYREAKTLGINARLPNKAEHVAISKILKFVSKITVIGTLVEQKEKDS